QGTKLFSVFIPDGVTDFHAVSLSRKYSLNLWRYQALRGTIKRVLDAFSWQLSFLYAGNTITFPLVLFVEDFLLVLGIVHNH
ncbi:hypothetical protein, partial [Citrobacter cronae]|uniref:hypothetical protein n=1 Tax=Citrobacter cronae TaxID=1748967 RepID=UPI0021D14F36